VSNAKRARSSVVAVCAIGVVIGTANPLRAQVAPDTPDRPSRFGMIGLAHGQTARLNLVYTPPEVGDLPSGSCEVMMRLSDGRDANLWTSTRRLAPGHAAFLDFTRSDRFSPPGRAGAQEPEGGDRQQIRAAWQVPDGGDMPHCRPSNFIATVEVFGRDGKTTAFQAPDNPDIPPDTPDLPPDGGDIPPDGPDRPSRFGMIGVVHGQTARLNLVFIPPDGADLPPGPCRVGLQFLDNQGAVLKTSEVSLAPGHAGFSDFVRSDRPSPPGRAGAQAPDVGDRQQIRAAWQEPDGPDMPQCHRSNFIATVEVFGRDGKTTVVYQAPDTPDVPQMR
jgi:hypothetical protein